MRPVRAFYAMGMRRGHMWSAVAAMRGVPPRIRGSPHIAVLPFFLHTAHMAKTKTTVYIDEDVLRGAKVMAARTGKKDYEVVEEALRAYLGMDVLDRAWGATDMPEDEALRLAVEEVHRFRSGSS